MVVFSEPPQKTGTERTAVTQRLALAHFQETLKIIWCFAETFLHLFEAEKEKGSGNEVSERWRFAWFFRLQPKQPRIPV